MPVSNSDDLARLQQQRQAQQPVQQVNPAANQGVQTGASAGNGVGVPANFQNLYRDLALKQEQQAQQEREQQENRRENATIFDKAVKSVFDVGDSLMNLGQENFQNQLNNGGLEKNPVGTLTALAATLPGSIIGSPIKGAAELAEVATGRDIQSLENGTINANKLDGSQRMWELLDAGVNIGGSPIGGSGRVFGAAGKAIAKTDTKAGEVIGKLMPNEGKGLVSKGLEKAGKNKAVQFGGQMLADSAEEGVEEFVQTFAEHGRAGDEFTGDTFNEALESAKWGAVGGAMMSGAGLAANTAMGQTKTHQEVTNSTPDASGLKMMNEITDEVETKDVVPTAKKAYDSTVTKPATKNSGAFGLMVATNPREIGLDEAHMGLDGFRAQWKASDETGRKALSEMVGLDERTVDDALAMDDMNAISVLNQNINGHHEYNLRSLKREPGTSKTTVHNVYVTKIVPGARTQLHPMTSQLGNGDIDADVKTLMNLPDHNYMLPSQLFLNPDGMSTDFALEYLPDLDTDEARNVLRRNMANRMQGLASSIGDKNLSRILDDLTETASRAKRNIDGSSSRDFMMHMNDLANTAMRGSGRNQEIASELMGHMFEAMYDTMEDSDAFTSIITREINVVKDDAEKSAEVEMASLDNRRISSGKTGDAKTQAAIAKTLDMITSLLVGTKKGSVMRNGQSIKYGIASKVEKFRDLDAVIRDDGTDSIERFLARTMKLVNVGEHINENITSMFNDLVLIRFMREAALSNENRMGSDNAVDTNKLLDLFIDVRKQMSTEFNKAVKKEFHTGLEAIVGSVEKGDINDREVAAGYLLETIQYFRMEDFFKIPEESPAYGMMIGDVVRMVAHDDMSNAITGHIGNKAGNLFNMMVSYERKSYDRTFNGIMKDNESLPVLTEEDLSTEQGYVTGTLKLEAVVHVLDPVVCLEQNLYEVYEAARSEYGWYLFSGNAEDIANVQLTATIRTAYKDVVESFEKYESTGNKDYLDLAINQAAALRGDSALSKSIYAELRENGTIKQIRYLSDMSHAYDDKVYVFKTAAERKGIRFENLLVSALALTQPDIDVITSRVRENKKTISQISEEAMTAAREEGRAIVKYLRDMETGAEKMNAMHVMAEFCNKDKFMVNDELFIAVIADSTNIHLHDNEKGTTIDSALMFYQQMEMLFQGAPTSLSTEMQERTINSMSVNDFMSNKLALIDILFNGREIYLTSAKGADPEPLNLERFLKGLGINGPTGPNGTMSINDFAALVEKCPQIIRVLEPHSITPSLNKNEDGGTSQVGTERSLGSFTRRFEKYMDDRSSGVENVIERQEKAELEKYLLNDKRFHIWFASMLTIEKDGTIRREEILQKKNEVIDDIYQVLGHFSDGDEVDIENLVISSGASVMAKSIVGSSSNPRLQYNDLARRIASGEVSMLFSQNFISDKICRDFVEKTKDEIGVDMSNGWNTISVDDVKKFLDVMTKNFSTIAGDMHDGVNGIVDDINGATFAMIGRERMAQILTQRTKNILFFDQFPDEYKSDLEANISEVVEEICNTFIDEKFVIEEDISLDGVDDSSIDRAKTAMWEKMKTIIYDPHYGAAKETQETLQENFEEAWSKSGKERQDMLEQVRIGVNGLILSNGIRQITSYTNSEVNEFFLEDTFTLSRSVKELFEDLRHNMDISVTQHRQNRKDRSISLPKSDMSNPMNAFVALMSGRHVSEGQIGTNVGVNGFVLGNMYGLSLVSHTRSCNAGPSDPVPITEFNVGEHLGESAIINIDGEERFVIISYSFDKRYYGNNATISVYDRSQCTCPMCKNHFGGTPNRFAKGYMRTTASYFDLLCWAQEQKNLKLKKALELVGNVVQNNKFDQLFRDDIDVASSEQEDVFAAAKECSSKMKAEISDRYSKVLDSYGAMDDLDPSISDTIASMNTSVVMITGANGDITYASLYELNDESIFAEIREKVGGEIAKVRSFPISYEQINAKIEQEILDGLKGKEDFSVHDTEEIAWKAVSEWRNYKTVSESMDYIAARMPLYQVGGQTNVIPGSHYTAEQLFRGQVNSDGTIKKHFAKRPESVDISKSPGIVDDNIKFQGKSDLDYLITDVEIVGDYYPLNPSDRDLENFNFAQRSLRPKAGKFFNGYKSAVIIADNDLTKGSIMKMVTEGYKGFDYVIVPKNTVQRSSIDYDNVDVWGEEFAIIDIVNANRESEFQNNVKFGEGYFDIAKVGIAYYDAINYYHLGDGPILMSQEWADNVSVDHVEDIRVNLDALPKTGTRYRVVPRNELVNISKKILNGESKCFYPDIERIGDVEADTKNWLTSIADKSLDVSTFDEDGYTSNYIQRNTPFAIIARTDATGAEYYMPAYATGEIPEVIDMISGFSFDEGTGEMRFHQSTELRFDQFADLKGTQSLEASKGMVRTHVQGEDVDLPVSDILNTDRVAVFNQNTRLGRIVGTSEKLQKESIFLAGKSDATHFAFVANNSGGVDINPMLNYDPTGTDPEALSASEVDLLMRDFNDERLLKEIARGNKKVFKEEHASLVVRRLAAECIAGNGITFSNLLCPYECTITFSEMAANPAIGQSAKLLCNPIVPRQISGVFRRFSFVDLKTLYSTMNKKICPNPYLPITADNTQTIMDSDGNIRMTVNGVSGYYPARLSYFTFMDEDSRVGERQVNSSYSMQQRVGYGLINGAAPSDVKLLVDAIRIKNADMSGYSELRDSTTHDIAYSVVSNYDPRQNLIDIDWLGGYGADRYNEQVKAQAETFKSGRLKIRKGQDDLSDPMSDSDFRNAFNKFKKAIGGDDLHVSVDLFLDVVVKLKYGWSYSDGDGDLSIPVQFVTSATQEFISDIKGKERVLIRGGINGTGDRSRVSFGLLPRNRAEQLWEVSPVVREKFETMDKFKESMMQQQENTLDAIRTFLTTGTGEKAARIAKKRDSLWLLNAYIQRTWGIEVPNNALYSNIVAQDYEDSLRMVTTGLFETTTEEVEKMIQQCKEARKQAIAAATRAKKKGLVDISIDGAPGGVVSIEKGHRKNPIQRSMDGSVSLMRVMSVTDPAVMAGNFLEGNLRGAVQDLATSLPGTFVPWGKDKRTFSGKDSNGNDNDNKLRAIAENQELQQLLKVMRETSLKGDLDAFLIGLQEEGATIESVAEKLYGNQRWYSKWADRVFSTVSMDTNFLKPQLHRMLMFLDTYITQGDYPALMRKDSDGVTQFERSLIGDPVGFFKNALSVDSPIRTEVLRAVNTSDTFSMAQRNAVSIVMENLTQKSSVVNFITATTLTPFIRYNTNVMGRGLNWFLPISSMNYVFVNQLSNFDSFKDMGIEQAQIYDSLKSALIVDAAHMGFTAVAAIIIALNFIDYPDDEDKRGNYGEYLFGGMRINEDYVLSDLTGPIFPYACFMKTVLDGKPRMDLLFNGITEISAKNPLMKVGELLDVILSPDQIYEDMEDQARNYEDTLAGKPDPVTTAKGVMEATTLSFLGKAFVPSFLRNFGASYDYERSYKRVWAPNNEPVDVSTGNLTDTVRVDYDEAMIRKVTRDNVVLGVIMNFLTNADTSFTGATSFGAKREMTPVVYTDPYQRFISEQYSIHYKDDNGEYVEKSENEKQAVALNIIATLQSYDDMNELYDQGFIIDGYTRSYVGDIIWQTVGQIQTTYYNWANSEDADYYVLGDGDFKKGQEIVQKAYNAMKESCDYWEDFYYNKLNSEPMKRGMQEYLRENVQYWQDDNGEYYASGFNKGMNLWNYLTGTKVAPGTMDDKQGTMGYEGDWATPSAVTGLTTGERALVALPQDIEETVPFSDLAENHKDLADAIEAAKNGTKKSSSGSGYGYGSRRSGGGGGGGSNIYSRPGSVNIQSGRTISLGRPYDSKLDYLRPGFETKGSREASRRSDF